MSNDNNKPCKLCKAMKKPEGTCEQCKGVCDEHGSALVFKNCDNGVGSCDKCHSDKNFSTWWLFQYGFEECFVCGNEKIITNDGWACQVCESE